MAQSLPKSVGVSAALDDVPEPKFNLPISSILTINGEECLVERRLPDGRWQLLSAERTPIFRSDRQLADHMIRGELHHEPERGLKVYAPPPLSPIAVGDKAHQQNLRKHAYVEACLLAPAGFFKSRARLLPAIKACAESRGETAPGFSTVLSWIAEWERHGTVYGTAAYSDRHDLKGNTGGRMQPFQEHALEHGIENWFKLRKKDLAYSLVVAHVRQYDEEFGHLLDKGALGPTYVDDKGALKPPSLRTFERRCARENRMLQDWALKGPAYAKQRNRTYQTTALADRPYAEVEVDHCTLDILVIDKSNMLLGRPDLIVFRDRATAMIVGYGLGFEQPSYASFVQGLKHAMYPKDIDRYPSITNPWPCYGRIENLFVDNALHFLGDNIRSAGRELGFNIVRFEPRQPWLKGALERFFGSLNTGLLHSLPGTTLHNVVVRRDHEQLGDATLTLHELEFLLNLWICDLYHVDQRKALGPLRGLGDSPLRVWAEKAASYRTPLLPDRDLFMSLAGDVEERTIQKDGIVWDYIKYECPELWALQQHPKHKRGRGATKYQVVRDPFDLGTIALLNPHNSAIIRVPATLGHRSYAEGLTLHQHKVIISNARERRGEQTDFDALQQAKARLAEIIIALRRQPGRRKIEKAIGRYLDNEKARRYRTEIIVPTEKSSAMLLDPGTAATPKLLDVAMDSDLVPDELAVTTWAEDEDDDLKALRSYASLEAYHG